MKAANPFAFRPGPVTFWTTIVYLAVIIPLLYVQETVPSAPSQRKLPDGVNLTEAWHDLQTITKSYHPYNSHENDRVRDYLMARAKEILERNDIDYTTELTGGVPWSARSLLSEIDHHSDSLQSRARQPGATVFDDRISNVTYAAQPLFNGSFVAASPVVGQYFEGNNFYVYVHGKDDPEGHWWQSETRGQAAQPGAGVLVNCHFDSVSTGFGATDDGISCISLLQMLSHFTSKGFQPKSGIVLLFNNAEEDGLLGARAFGYSPLVQFCHSFVNLEGAGAGGRAMLFRTTDLETAKAYSKSPHPFGSVVAANAFEKGFIRSGTDYSVFADEFGQRGLDIAFYAPRSRYHTGEDDARHTSKDSIWHMLSAALASTDSLSESTASTFNGPRSDNRKDLVQNGRPTDGVWFDWFGRAWATLPLRGLFAWSLTLLITTPLILAVVTFLLVRKDKYYFFSKDVDMDEGTVPLGGWKGLVRFPFALVVAGALTIGSVYLVGKINPLIVYSSGYAVWAMMLSLFYFAFWLIARGASFVRPSALQRGYALIWLFILTWFLHVGAAVAEDRMKVGGVYFIAFLHSSVFLCLLITLLEQFSLPGKQDFASQPGIADEEDESSGASNGGGRTNGQTDSRSNEDEDSAENPTETTPLRAGEQGYGANDQPTTFASTYRRSVSESREAAADSSKVRSFEPYGNEQAWSGRLSSWTWLLQLLLLAPIHVIILGNLGLTMTTAMSMTGTDGSGLLAPLMGIGVLSILLLLPLTPFIHRVTHHVPLFLMLVFIGTMIYNLVAFPFSINNRFKFTFQQVIDIDQGTNVVGLLGLEEYVRPVAASMPSTAGQRVACDATGAGALKNCQYDGTHVTPDLANGTQLENLVSIEAVRDGARSITVKVDALNTRSCFLDFSSPVYEFSVEGGSKRDERFGTYPREGLKHIQLWRRKWEGGWTVKLEFGDDSSSVSDNGLETIQDEEDALGNNPGDGELRRRASAVAVTARCVWSDANKASTIPALDEVKKYMPSWSIVSKRSIGLVEVKKTIKVA